jgi:hypothetical protein
MVQSVKDQIDGALSDLAASKKSGIGITGLMGTANRAAEWLGTTTGLTEDTSASDFQTKIDLIKAQLPRLLTGTSRLAADERAAMDNIVRGLGRMTSPAQAESALIYVKKVLDSRFGPGTDASTRGGMVTPSTQQTQGLKRMTPEIVAKMNEALNDKDTPHSRAEVEQFIRSLGYDPALRD